MNALTFAIFKTATTSICMIIAVIQYWGFKNCKAAMAVHAKRTRAKKGKKLISAAKKKKAANKEDGGKKTKK